MRKLSVYISAILCLLLYTACSDDYSFPSFEKHGNVTLILPGALTRVDDSKDDTDNPSDAISLSYGGTSEGSIDNELGLWFYAFPNDGKNKTVIKEIREVDLEPEVANHRKFSLDLDPGKYDFCVAANIPGLGNVKSFNELKNLVLNYTKESLGQLRPGRLPMYRTIDVTVDDSKEQLIDMHLVFLCSKVVVKMMSETQSPLALTGLTLSHVASQSKVGVDECKEISNLGFLGEGNDAINCNFQKDSGKDWKTIDIKTENVGNVGDYLIAYLPEYYNEDNDSRTQTFLNFTVAELKDGQPNNDRKNVYELPLGGDAEENCNLKEAKGGNLERGVQYNITVTLKEKEVGEDWTLKVENFEWTTELMDVAFMQTTLWVSDTEKDSHVIPFVGGEFEYKSNAAVELECQEKINGKEIFIFNTEDGPDGKKKVTAMLNPALSVKDFEGAGFTQGTAPDGTVSYEGTAHVILKANNLKKIIDFEFKKYEMFEVEPTHVTLRKDATSDFYICRTNMGEVSIDYTLNDYYDLKPEPMPDGSIKITATGKKFTDKRYETFDLVVTKNGKEVKRETLSLTIIPSDKQVVHFTSINSHLKGESSSTLTFCAGFNGDFDPRYNIDYCTESPFNFKYPQTLVSDTETGTDVHYWKTPQIHINSGTGVSGTKNGRWTDFTLDNATNSTVTFTGGDSKVEYRLYKSFHINDDDCVIANDTPIRYPYRDTKLQMFHFESQEGWIVADPTVVKVQFLDFEPKIVDVTYVVDVINCDEQAYGMRWYLNYGQIFEGSNKVGRFLIQSQSATNGNYNYDVIKTYKVEEKHYRFVFKLKSVAHNTAKDINLTIRTQNGTIELGKLFAGEDYADRSMGTPDNMTVYGTYDVATDRWSKTTDKPIGDNYGTTLTTTLEKLQELPNNPDTFRIYFYLPMEPYAWNDSFVGINLGGKNGDASWHLEKEKKLHQLDVSSSSKRRWFYIDINEVPDFDKGENSDSPYGRIKSNNFSGQMIAIFYNKYWNDLDQSSGTGGNSSLGYIYKSDCWSWATADNNYYPDFKVNAGGGKFIGNGKVMYFMDRKAFITRPR